MTELSFLIELLLNHKLPKTTKDAVAARIRDVEAVTDRVVVRQPVPITPQPANAFVAMQSPSTQALLAKHPDLIPQGSGAAPPQLSAEVPPPPVAIIAQTPATIAAMASRQQAIAESMAGKTDKATGRPRKF